MSDINDLKNRALGIRNETRTGANTANRVGQLSEEFNTPSISEMESITNMLNQLIVRNDEFRHRFETLGNKEFNKVH